MAPMVGVQETLRSNTSFMAG